MPIFKNPTKNTFKLLTASLITATLTACATHQAPLYQKTPPPPDNTLTDAQLIKIAKWDERQPVEYISKQVIGVHNGVTVIEEMQCSDVCPENTAQVVYYEVPTGATCDSIGGVTKSILTPIAITVMPMDYCLPAVIADYWQSYP